MYRKKVGYRKRFRRKAMRYGRVALKYGPTAVKLASDVYRLKNLINVEFKYAQANSSSTPSTAAATLLLLNGLTKGDDSTDREGRQIRMKSVQYNVRSLINGAATATLVRVMLVLDTQPNAAAPTIANILETTGGLYVDAFRNLSNRKRFIILKDDKQVLDSDDQYNNIDCYKQFNPGFKTVYNSGNAGTIADITTNALYLVAISDEATNTPSVNMYYRIRFIDN